MTQMMNVSSAFVVKESLQHRTTHLLTIMICGVLGNWKLQTQIWYDDNKCLHHYVKLIVGSQGQSKELAS